MTRLAILVILLLVIGCGKVVPDGGKADPPRLPVVEFPEDGPDWTYLELLEHLRSKGEAVKMTISKGDQLFVLNNDDQVVYSVYAYREQSGFIPNGAAVVQKFSSAKDAKENVGHYEKGAFQWRRFSFIGSEETLAIFRKALGK